VEKVMRYTVVLCKATDGRLKVNYDYIFGPISRKAAFFAATKEFGSINNPKEGWYVIAVSPGQHEVFYFDEDSE
tara:strand:- start:109 stop:330 length:222 start_codon:yes stop_codon:yes gene_type:complete